MNGGLETQRALEQETAKQARDEIEAIREKVAAAERAVSEQAQGLGVERAALATLKAYGAL